MLDNFTIFARGGIILFSWSAVALKGNPIDALISTVLLEERSGQQSFPFTSGSTKYVLKWTFSNELGLVFVAVYQSILQVLYVEDLLNQVKSAFVAKYKPGTLEYPEFVDEFQRMLNEQEQRADEIRKNRAEAAKKTRSQTQQQIQGSKRQDSQTPPKKGKGSVESSKSNGSSNGNGALSEVDETAVVENSSAKAFDISKLQKRGSNKSPAKGKGSKDEPPKPSDKKPKQMRKWEDSKPSPDEKLDFSVVKPGDSADDSAPLDRVYMGKSGMDVEEEEEEEDDDEDDDDDEEEDEAASTGKGVASSSGKRGWLSSMLRGVVGTESLEEDDLSPVLQELKSRLMAKNVASEIAEKLCDSVSSGLLGKRQSSFTRVASTVKTAMHDALVRILTPRRTTDILREVQASKEKGQPYSIVFIGVNGVGKSTNLAK
eukprot:gene25754-31507_t